MLEQGVPRVGIVERVVGMVHDSFPSLGVLVPKVHLSHPSPYHQLISTITLPRALLTAELETIFAEGPLVPNDVMNPQIRDNIY